MGETFSSSLEYDLMDLIRQDEYIKVKDIILKNNLNKDILIGEHKRTLIQYSSYFGSVNCLKELIDLNFDINKLEYNTNNTSLFIACKFNYIEFVYILLNNKKQKCEILRKNNEGLNEFEVAFLRGNYEVCYYLLYLYKEQNDKNIINSEEEEIQLNNNYYKFFTDEINFSLEKYLGIQEYLSYPVFNLPLFYNSLKQKISPEKCLDFSPEKKKKKELMNKVPDPNETWTNFMKRLINMELYNPPLVDKNKINKTNSLYMKTQMKIISMEYGINMDFKNDTNDKNNILNLNKININNKNKSKDDNDINDINNSNDDEKKTISE